MSKNIAIYPGTFDPITKGHIDVIERSLKIFAKVLVAVAEDSGKKPLFTIDQRVALIQAIFAKNENIEVCTFSGLLVNFAKQKDIKVIIRGLRAFSDFEYEIQLANINRYLDANIETMFLVPSEKYSCISSSMVREIAKLGGDLTKFVHPDVEIALRSLSFRNL